MDQQELLQQHVQQAPKTHTFDPFVVCLVFLALLLIPKLKGIASNVKLPPSPPKLPLIGNLHQLRSSPNHTLGVLSKKYGPLMLLHFGQTPTLVVSSPEVAMDIMKTHDMTFANRHQSVAANTFFYGCKELAFSPYGEYWRELKRLCVSELLSSKRTESFQFIREDETANLIEKIREACVEKVPVNLSELIISTANNIICRCVLGKKYEGDEAGTGFGQVSLKAMDLMLAFSFREFFPFIGWMDNFTGYNRKLKEIFNEMDGFLEQVVKKHENNIIKNEQSEKKNFVEILLQLKKDGNLGFELTREGIKGLIMDMLVGGNDTSSLTLEWMMAEFAKSPSALKKAQEEVRRVVGRKGELDVNDINQMDHLKSAVKETLRLHPPVPFLNPRETKSWVKLRGYDIPPKTTVLINAWAIQRDPMFWDMPEEFHLERFYNNPVDFKGQDFQFIPFGSGRRGCPGMLFGLANVEYLIVNLLYWFDWDLPMGTTREDLDMTESYGFVLHKKTPLHLVPKCYNP